MTTLCEIKNKWFIASRVWKCDLLAMGQDSHAGVISFNFMIRVFLLVLFCQLIHHREADEVLINFDIINQLLLLEYNLECVYFISGAYN